MTNDSNDNGKRETRMMLAFSAGIVALILGMMGANMLFHHPSQAELQTDYSSQSRPAAPN